jgi:hypothetical protein
MNRRVFVQQLRSNILKRMGAAPKAKVIVKYDHALVFLNGEPESIVIEGVVRCFRDLQLFHGVPVCTRTGSGLLDLAVQLLMTDEHPQPDLKWIPAAKIKPCRLHP